MQRTRRVLLGTLAGILQIVIATILQIVLMPLILQAAGQEVLGAYAIIIQVIGYMALIDLGVYTALTRFLSQSTHDDAQFLRFLSSAFFFFFLLGIAYTLIGTVFAFVLPDLIHLSSLIAQETTVAMLLISVWGLLRFPLGIFPTALLSIQDLAFPPLAGAATNALRMITSILAVQAGWGLIGLSGANVLTEALLSLVLFFRFRHLRPKWSIKPAYFQRTLLVEMLRFGAQAFWGNLAGRVILFTDNLVVGNLYGAAQASVYYNTQTPISIPYSIVFRLADNASPGINELWALGDWDKLRDVFLRLQRLTLLMVLPIVIGGWFYLANTLRLWVGAEQYAGQWMTLWLVLFAVLVTVSHVSLVFVYASGKIKRFSQIITVEAIVNLTLSFILGAKLGLHGVALATTIATIPTVVYLQIRTHRNLGISWAVWGSQALRPVAWTALPTAGAAFLLSSSAPPDTWGMLILHGGLLGIVYMGSVFLLGLTTQERTWAKAFVTRRLRPQTSS